MARLFVGNKELTFFDSIQKEHEQKTLCQKIIYYAISEEHTNVDDLYDEAVTKSVYYPIEINARVLYEEPEQINDQFSIDTRYNIEVYFDSTELKERNVIPREGDFVKFGNIVYEINSLTKPQLTFGQIENQVMLKAVCHVARESQFKVLDGLEAI